MFRGRLWWFPLITGLLIVFTVIICYVIRRHIIVTHDIIAVGSIAVRSALRLARYLALGILEPFLSSEVAAVLEHVTRVWMQSPEGAFARFVGASRYLDEAVIKR